MIIIEFGFEKLEVWKKARVFKKEIRQLTETFPAIEKFRLNDQLIRSSRGINALLSEGHGRYTFTDQLHFCIQSRGSLYESVNHLIDTFDENYIDENKLNYFKVKAQEIERLLNGYIAYLRKRREAK